MIYDPRHARYLVDRYSARAFPFVENHRKSIKADTVKRFKIKLKTGLFFFFLILLLIS